MTSIRFLIVTTALAAGVLPASAQGEVVTPHQVTPQVVTPQVVTPPPAASPAGADVQATAPDDAAPPAASSGGTSGPVGIDVCQPGSICSPDQKKLDQIRQAKEKKKKEDDEKAAEDAKALREGPVISVGRLILSFPVFCPFYMDIYNSVATELNGIPYEEFGDIRDLFAGLAYQRSCASREQF